MSAQKIIYSILVGSCLALGAGAALVAHGFGVPVPASVGLGLLPMSAYVTYFAYKSAE